MTFLIEMHRSFAPMEGGKIAFCRGLKTKELGEAKK